MGMNRRRPADVSGFLKKKRTENRASLTKNDERSFPVPNQWPSQKPAIVPQPTFPRSSSRSDADLILSHPMSRLAYLLIFLAAIPTAFSQTAGLSIFGITNVWRFEQTASFDGVNWQS